MLKRKYYYDLLEWKKRRKNNAKECLLVKGARQVGKTSLIDYFGKNEYKSYININFISHPEFKEIFQGNKDSSSILMKMSLFFPNFKLIKGDTLIFLDEIQYCGNARTSLKFLAQSFDFDVIASGSLLGLEYGEEGDSNVEVPDSIPVGYESTLTMYSLDFKEFLWAKGYEDKHIEILKDYFDKKTKIDDSINETFLSLFKEFIVIGGMPEVVETFINTNNFNEAFKIQDKILTDYRNDISKHAKGEEKIKVVKCYDSIPKQLNRNLRKFQYSFVEKGKTRKKFGNSVKWLIDSSLVNPCYNVTEPLIPLLGNEIEEQFKLYYNDTGLLVSIYGRATQQAVLNNTLLGNIKGAIYENVIAECLIKNGYKLHYYKPDDYRELEFLIENEVGIIPIEVKAGNSASISLNGFIETYKPKIAYKIISGNIGIDKIKYTIPHYMILFI